VHKKRRSVVEKKRKRARAKKRPSAVLNEKQKAGTQGEGEGSKGSTEGISNNVRQVKKIRGRPFLSEPEREKGKTNPPAFGGVFASWGTGWLTGPGRKKERRIRRGR